MVREVSDVLEVIMKSNNKRHIAFIVLCALCCGPLSVLLSGCAAEEKPSAASGYYTGPMEGKGKKPDAPKID